VLHQIYWASNEKGEYEWIEAAKFVCDGINQLLPGHAYMLACVLNNYRNKELFCCMRIRRMLLWKIKETGFFFPWSCWGKKWIY
jgi:hypothetical protein